MRWLGLGLALLALPSTVLAGDSIAVDASGGGDFLTISEALATTPEDGTTVTVAAGTYNENIVLGGLAVNLVGAGREVVQVVGDGTGSVVSIGPAAGSQTHISGMEISGGDSRSTDGFGGCITVVQADPVLEELELTDCLAREGGGLSLRDSEATVRDLVIHDCEAHALAGQEGTDDGRGHGGAVYVSGGVADIRRLHAYSNLASGYGGGLSFWDVPGGSLEDTVISTSAAQWGGGVVTARRDLPWGCCCWPDSGVAVESVLDPQASQPEGLTGTTGE
ncbi:MAG: hypothetical protein GY898_08205 [Proteobacteria bacterium]|nr:hypothetical protein [Pseudomonadota bacterium]